MATTPRQAIFAKLKDSSITSLLPDGASAVLLAGRVTLSSPNPCIALEMGPKGGRVTDLPHTSNIFNVLVYSRAEGASQADFTFIDTLLNAAQNVLDGASLTFSGVREVAFECAWEYRSRDLFDERRRSWYRYDRYRVWSAKTDHYH